MKNRYELGQEQFDALLVLFSADRDEAGEKYEQIRRGLVRFFHYKGCSDPQSLVDETINRVAVKIHKFDHSRNITPASYFYGFAANILLEYRRNSAREISLDDGQYAYKESAAEDESDKAETSCLHKCLEKLSVDEKELFIEYYARERQEKIEFRRKMCELLNCRAAALQSKIFRIKSSLRGCIENCMEASA